MSLETACFLPGPKHSRSWAGTFNSQGWQRESRWGRQGPCGGWYPRSSQLLGVPEGSEGASLNPRWSVSRLLPEQGPKHGLGILCSCKSGRFEIISQLYNTKGKTSSHHTIGSLQMPAKCHVAFNVVKKQTCLKIRISLSSLTFDNHDLHPFPATRVKLGETSCPLIPTPPSRGAGRQPHRYYQPCVLVGEGMTICRRFRRKVLWS